MTESEVTKGDGAAIIISGVMLGVKRVVNKYGNPEIAPKQMNGELDEIYREALKALFNLLAAEAVEVTQQELVVIGTAESKLVFKSIKAVPISKIKEVFGVGGADK